MTRDLFTELPLTLYEYVLVLATVSRRRSIEERKSKGNEKDGLWRSENMLNERSLTVTFCTLPKVSNYPCCGSRGSFLQFKKFTVLTRLPVITYTEEVNLRADLSMPGWSAQSCNIEADSILADELVHTSSDVILLLLSCGFVGVSKPNYRSTWSLSTLIKLNECVSDLPCSLFFLLPP